MESLHQQAVSHIYKNIQYSQVYQQAQHMAAYCLSNAMYSIGQNQGREVSRHVLVLRQSRGTFLVSWSWSLEKCSVIQLPVSCSLLNVPYTVYSESCLEY